RAARLRGVTAVALCERLSGIAAAYNTSPSSASADATSPQGEALGRSEIDPYGFHRSKKPPQLMLRRFAIHIYFTYHRSATWTQEAFWPVTKASPRWMLWASTVLPLT